MSETKILLISSNSSARGGGERYLVFMAMGLQCQSCEVHVLLADAEFMDGWAKELEGIGAHVHRLPLDYLGNRRFRFVQSMLDFSQHEKIAAFCRRLHPAAILCNQQYDEDGMDYIQGALKAGICPVAGIIHMPMTANKNQRPLGWLRGIAMRRWYNKHQYRIIFSSTGGEQEFLGYYKLSVHTEVLPSGIPLTRERSSRRASIIALNDPWLRDGTTGLMPGIPTIGAVCQFVPQKNLHLLIDAWQWAATTGALSRLLLIGDGPQRQEIEARLASTDKDFWHITGWGEKYTDYMAQLDIFLMPSLFEGLPLAFVEAVAMGIPSIVSNFNGATDVAAQSGWVEIVNPLGAESLGRAIARAVRNAPAAIPEADRQRFIEYFSPARMAADFLHILESTPTT